MFTESWLLKNIINTPTNAEDRNDGEVLWKLRMVWMEKNLKSEIKQNVIIL